MALGGGERDVLGRAQRVRAQALPERERELARALSSCSTGWGSCATRLRLPSGPLSYDRRPLQPLFEHRVHAAGYETRALELEGDGPGLVLLHGWGDSADTWRPLLAELGARDRRAIAVDLPGFGTASRLTGDAMLPQLDAFAAALVEEWAGDEDVVWSATRSAA